MSAGEKNIISEAVADAARLRRAAEQVAQTKIVEKLTPSIKSLIESQIRSELGEDVDRVRRGLEGRGENPKWEESVENLPEGDLSMDKEKDEFELESMFPGLAEMEDEFDDEGLPEMGGKGGPGMDFKGGEELPEMGGFGGPEDEFEEGAYEMNIPTLGEDKDEEDMDMDMDEDVTIDEKELAKAYESIMKMENALQETSVDWSPQVSSGFKDSYPSSEWETEEKPPSDRGLEAKEKENAPWEQQKPAKVQDYSVKESIDRALRESPALRSYVSHLEENLGKAARIIKKLKNEVREVNLFNTKVLRVNEMISGKSSLTMEQKKVVIEKIDEATSIREVNMVAESLKAAFKVPLQEQRRRGNRPNASRARSSGSPNQKVLRESVDNSGANPRNARWAQLADIVQ